MIVDKSTRHKEKINELRDYYAEHPRKVSSIMTLEAGLKKDFQKLLQKYIGYLDGATVLDLGCGKGGAWRACQHLGASRYIAYDILDSNLSDLRWNIPEADCLVGDFHAVCLASESVDLVLCLDILEHSLSIPTVLSQSARLLKDDGHIFISVPNFFNGAGLAKIYHESIGGYAKNSWTPFRDDVPQAHHQLVLAPRLLEQLRQAGFQIQHIGGYDLVRGLFPFLFDKGRLRVPWKWFWELDEKLMVWHYENPNWLTARISQYLLICAQRVTT